MTGAFASFALVVELHAEKCQTVADARPHRGACSPMPPANTSVVEAAEGGGERADRVS